MIIVHQYVIFEIDKSIPRGIAVCRTLTRQAYD